MKEKEIAKKFAQLYGVRINRMECDNYGRVSIGQIDYTLYSGKIKEAYQSACKKGEEVFGKPTYVSATKRGEYNVVQVRIAPMSRNEE